jgi:hypothetical protein
MPDVIVNECRRNLSQADGIINSIQASFRALYRYSF